MSASPPDPAPGRAGPRRPGPIAPWVQDAALALAVAASLAAIITIAQADADRSPSVVAYLFALGFGAVLLLRRSLPVAVLVLSVLGTFAYYTLELPTVGVALPVVAALYSAAERGLLRWAIGAGVVLFTVSLAFRLRDDPQPLGYLLGTDSVTNIALIAAAIALGYGVRSHRVRTAQQQQIALLTEEQARREAQLRIREEREWISRELHDTVGHALSVISLQSGVASDAIRHDRDEAERALGQVRDQAIDSLTELRSMVRLLRTDPDDGSAGPGDETGSGRHVRSLADVPAILARAEEAGLRVESAIDVGPGQLSTTVDTAAYRVIQESVTNALRHAEATSIQVTARLEGTSLHLEVVDDGRGAPEGIRPGYGIIGMQERIRLLGGTLTARSPTSGFTVTARLPARLAP